LEAYLNTLTEFSASNIWFDGAMVMERHATDAVLAIPESKRGVYAWRDTKFEVYETRPISLLNAVFFFFFLVVRFILKYNHRFFLTKTPSAEYDDRVDAFVKPIRQEFQDTMGFDTMHVYLNHAFGDEGPVSWYGAHNLPRLVALKQQWDPDNKFGAGCPVPLSLG
jgi:hypothetical protein